MNDAKEMTTEEMQLLKEHRRAMRRAYWDRMPEDERKERRRKAQANFWGKMTAEERREKRKQYDLAQAKRLAAEASAAKDGAE